MIIKEFRLFESKDEPDIISDLHSEWKDSSEENQEKVLRKIKKAAIKSTDLKPWFTKFRGNRKVMVELKKIKYKN